MTELPNKADISPLEHARRRLEEIKAKYTRPSEAEYLRLLVAAWEYHIRILEHASNATTD